MLGVVHVLHDIQGATLIFGSQDDAAIVLDGAAFVLGGWNDAVMVLDGTAYTHWPPVNYLASGLLFGIRPNPPHFIVQNWCGVGMVFK